MNTRIAYLFTFILLIALMVVVTHTTAAQESNDSSHYINPVYGFEVDYPAGYSLVSAEETGGSYVTEFIGTEGGAPIKLYVVVENFDGSAGSLDNWLAQREGDFSLALYSSQTTELDGLTGTEKVFGSEENSLVNNADDNHVHGGFHIAQYFLNHNKVYLLNIGPLPDPTLPEGFQKLRAGFHWLEGEYPNEVPQSPLISDTTDLIVSEPVSQPPLQYPFCGSWRITQGYYYQTPGHPNNNYNRHALDWVNHGGGTQGSPIYAAHSGNISYVWDSAGGGHTVRIHYASDTTYRSVYAHLSAYSTSGWANTGQRIGRAGCTGTGCTPGHPHLHFGLLHNGSSIKPEPMSGTTGFAPNQVKTRINCNLALLRNASASSQQGGGYEPWRGNDGNLGSRWSSNGAGTQWWKANLGTQTFNRVVIRWETAYAARHFVGWSNDGINFTGYWFNISAPGNYAYNIGTRTAAYVGVIMTNTAPCCGNYSFWETEVYRTTSQNANLEDTIELPSAGRPITVQISDSSIDQ